MSDNTNYKLIFEKAESTLISIGDQDHDVDMRGRLEQFKLAETTFSDDDYFRIMVRVVFYSGFSAAKVKSRVPAINAHFGDFRTVSNYTSDAVGAILADSKMIRNRRKIEACVDNAIEFASIVGEYGSFRPTSIGLGIGRSMAPSSSGKD